MAYLKSRKKSNTATTVNDADKLDEIIHFLAVVSSPVGKYTESRFMIMIFNRPELCPSRAACRDEIS